MKNMKMALMTAMALMMASPAFAADGVINQDQQRVDQDKKDLRQDRQDIKKAKEEIKADKASGNTAKEQTDVKALKEARRNKREEKRRLKKDVEQKHHDEKNP